MPNECLDPIKCSSSLRRPVIMDALQKYFVAIVTTVMAVSTYTLILSQPDPTALQRANGAAQVEFNGK